MVIAPEEDGVLSPEVGLPEGGLAEAVVFAVVRPGCVGPDAADVGEAGSVSPEEETAPADSSGQVSRLSTSSRPSEAVEEAGVVRPPQPAASAKISTAASRAGRRRFLVARMVSCLSGTDRPSPLSHGLGKR